VDLNRLIQLAHSVAYQAGLVSEFVASGGAESVTAVALRTAEQIGSLSRPVIAMGKAFFAAQIEMSRTNAYR
jgi:enoyl-CoA hydratase/carnithine racemase